MSRQYGMVTRASAAAGTADVQSGGATAKSKALQQTGKRVKADDCKVGYDG